MKIRNKYGPVSEGIRISVLFIYIENICFTVNLELFRKVTRFNYIHRRHRRQCFEYPFENWGEGH